MQRSILCLSISLLLLSSWLAGSSSYTAEFFNQQSKNLSLSPAAQPGQPFTPPNRGLPLRRVGGGTR